MVDGTAGIHLSSHSTLDSNDNGVVSVKEAENADTGQLIDLFIDAESKERNYIFDRLSSRKIAVLMDLTISRYGEGLADKFWSSSDSVKNWKFWTGRMKHKNYVNERLSLDNVPSSMDKNKNGRLEAKEVADGKLSSNIDFDTLALRFIEVAKFDQTRITLKSLISQMSSSDIAMLMYAGAERVFNIWAPDSSRKDYVSRLQDLFATIYSSNREGCIKATEAMAREGIGFNDLFSMLLPHDDNEDPALRYVNYIMRDRNMMSLMKEQFPPYFKLSDLTAITATNVFTIDSVTRPVVVLFGADWSADMNKSRFYLSHKLKQYNEAGLEILTVDVNDMHGFGHLLKKYDIKKVPTIIVLNNEKVVIKHEGLISDDAMFEPIDGVIQKLKK